MANSDIYRVKIDLRHFFSDHKSKAYVSINRQWKNVRQFHRHITDIFDVNKFVLLTNDGVYLPAKEHIGIIESGDIIHVIPKHDQDTESIISEAMASLTEQNVNKQFNKPVDNDATFKMPDCTTPSIEILSPKKSNDECAESVDTNDTNGTGGSKRKRVRHRKRKTRSVVNDENQMNLPNVRVEPPTPGGTSMNSDSFEKSLRCNPIQPIQPKHVRFADDEESLSELDEEVILPKTARIIRATIIDVANTIVAVTDVKMENPIEKEEKDIEATIPSKSLEVQQINGKNVKDNDPVSAKKQETALEQLAKNLETMGKYKDLHNDVNELDMIAFKVFTPNFEKSDYVIALVESIIGRNNPEQQDFDLALQVMAGKNHIEHLNDIAENDGNDSNIRIQINRMDIFDAKILIL